MNFNVRTRGKSQSVDCFCWFGSNKMVEMLLLALVKVIEFVTKRGEVDAGRNEGKGNMSVQVAYYENKV